MRQNALKSRWFRLDTAMLQDRDKNHPGLRAAGLAIGVSKPTCA
jgi:hypothetical protein